jgi:hypothetical protein
MPASVRGGQRAGLDLGRRQALERPGVDLGQALVHGHGRHAVRLGGRDRLARDARAGEG